MLKRNHIILLSFFFSMIIVVTACGNHDQSSPPLAQESEQNNEEDQQNSQSNTSTNLTDQEKIESKDNNLEEEPLEEDPNPSHPIIVDPDHTAVLVNKEYGLPKDYKPDDLVYPDVHFIFSEKIEKRMLRKEAAEALEQMFAGAQKDGIYLGGVSGYRSHETQTALFNRYVQRDGEEKAKTYSAVPGHSEHETGLAIDVSGSDGKCAAQDCFAETKEAEWLATHAWEYGFIIRYPKGKEEITGYQYEPWHLRYVGREIAQEIHEREITLEEYYNAVPVSE